MLKYNTIRCIYICFGDVHLVRVPIAYDVTLLLLRDRMAQKASTPAPAEGPDPLHKAGMPETAYAVPLQSAPYGQAIMSLLA